MENKLPPSHSTDSLEESLLPIKDTEAEIIFSPALQQSTHDDFSASATNPSANTGARRIRLGGADLNAPGHQINDPEEEGMLMGPHHPAFTNPQDTHSRDPRGYCPPGARFDPISPISPTGDPDFDDLLPPHQLDPLSKGLKPPQIGKKSHGTNDNPFQAPFGHPHGAPPGSGNPPFFM